MTLFSFDKIKMVASENLLMISLLESGNTLEGVVIAYKTLSATVTASMKKFDRKSLKGKIHPLKNIKDVFTTEYKSFMRNWKKWKCHCCLKYMTETGDAIVCSNIMNIQD